MAEVTPEALAFCLEDTREQILEAYSTAQSTGLYQPTEAERLRRRILAIQELARGNDSQRQIARYYAGQMKATVHENVNNP